MDDSEARDILQREVRSYRARGRTALLSLLGQIECRQVTGRSGTIYQIEVEATWDDAPDGDLRVIVSIDDGGLRAFFPLTEDFIVSPAEAGTRPPGSRIERLQPPVTDADVAGLASLLVGAVDSGAAVSFLAPLTQDQAETWWRTTFASSHPGAVFLAGRESGQIVGSVQLHPAWAPNQAHRAEVSKLLVHSGFRRSGLGTRLMRAIENEALAAGFRLLTLDARRGEAAESLYRKTGWTEVGTIPRYAVDPDGQGLHDAVLFYKELGQRSTKER